MEPRFVADVMLGRLARWLRAMGYDTAYNPAWDDGQLAEIARAEQRVLLTRDVELTRRRGIQCVLIRDDRVFEQLAQLRREQPLTDAGAFTRCIECNAELRQVDAQTVAARVPPYVLATQTRFKQCPQCAKIYWRGTHWNHMRDVLSAMEQDSA
jgi:uncharacterized protein with PIN domain